MSAGTARPLAIAHRGSAHDHPENTRAAFAAAVAAGADAIELDVRLSADGAVVVAHDADLRRCAGRRLRIAQATLAELRRIEVGAWFHPRFAGEPLPTLDDTLRAFPCTRFLIELKPARARLPDGGLGGAALAAAVVAAIAAAGADARVEVLCFAAAPLAAVHRLAPALPLVRNAAWLPWRLRPWLRAAPLAAVDLDQRRVTPAAVARLHGFGLRVYTYTVDTPAALARVRRAGVDGVISNRPAWLRAALAEPLT